MTLTQKFKSNLKDKHFGEVLKGSIFSFIARGSAGLIALTIQVLVIRLYGTDILGITELINSFLMVAIIIPLLGTNVSILRFIPEYTAKGHSEVAFRIYRRLLYFVITSSIFFILIVTLNSNFVAEVIFKKPQYTIFFLVAGFFIPFRVLYEYTLSVTRGFKLIKTFALFQALPLFCNLLVLGLLTIFYYHGFNPIYALFSGFFLASVAGIYVSELRFRSLSHNKNPQSTSSDSPIAYEPSAIPPLKNLLMVSTPMFLITAMGYINNQIGVLLLGGMKSEREIAYYAVAAKLATLIHFVLQAINSMIAPKFAELYHSGMMKELKRVIHKSTKLIFYSTAPILTGLLIFGRLVLKIFYGEEFIIAYTPLLILIVGQFVNTISGSVGYFLTMTGNEKTVSLIISASSLINIITAYLLIPLYGINGAAIASSLCLIIWNLLMVVVIRLRYGIMFIYMPKAIHVR
ncbi:MAG: flippase [Cytophagaceae bacterium]